MEGCNRCQVFVEKWDRSSHFSDPVLQRKAKLRALENMETMFLTAGCDNVGMVCLPLVRLERKTIPDKKVV